MPLSEFKQINKLLSPLNLSETYDFLMISGGI